MQAVIVQKVKAQITPLLQERGVDLVEVSQGRTQNRALLRILVDRPGGITLDEVSQLNRVLSEHLGQLTEPLGPYLLEVSSPGLDRPLKTEADFRRAKGEVVRVVTREPIEGENTYTGPLEGIEEGQITVNSEERGRIDLKLAAIAKARRIIKP